MENYWVKPSPNLKPNYNPSPNPNSGGKGKETKNSSREFGPLIFA